ncbi:polysaccharide biosynthesis/export family protein [Marimonas lutisalis]|uniref:polysaccharide biosynthesis/export family protein n=1 Tax=Marimonas lutisalis TaxID=2545756 RepID=UPI00137649A4|nr:polysaccharide biosynthesis/export family protein [Marimonas lutisalis]
MVAAQAGAIPDDYIINIGDEIELDILDDSDAPQRFTVGRDGAVQLPFIGGLELANVPVATARQRVRQTYIEREIFVNPSVELSIATFRPVSVLGDVREPGNFDFQPFMTAEQAVGLAGGPAISANNEEARVLERRNLEGVLSNLEYDLAAAAAQYARVRAQLQGAEVLQWSDVPPDLRTGINRELFDEQKAEEDQIIALERRDADTRRGLLADALAEAEGRVALLKQRERVQTEILDASKAELARTKEMAERGLVPKADISEEERRTALAEDNLLQLREQRAGVLVQVANLKSELSQFDAERERALLSESQRFLNEIKKQIASRSSVQDRIRLLQQWMNAAAGMQTELLVSYQVRRRGKGGVETLELRAFDELLPGDLLVVTVIPPETMQAPG